MFFSPEKLLAVLVPFHTVKLGALQVVVTLRKICKGDDVTGKNFFKQPQRSGINFIHLQHFCKEVDSSTLVQAC